MDTEHSQDEAMGYNFIYSQYKLTQLQLQFTNCIAT